MPLSATRRACAGAALLLLGACADQPTSPLSAPEDKAAASVALLTCTARVADGTFNCDPSSAASTGGAQMDLVVGSQHQFIRMANTVPVISGGVWSADVTVQNLTLQPMGTLDGSTPHAKGVRVFFTKLPTNGVTVSNADGDTIFNAATAQKYYQYGGTLLGTDQILASGEVSSAKSWQFALNGATTFSFTVLVSAPVPDESAFSVRLSGLDMGAAQSCAQGSDGKAYCWGNNSNGQLGDGTSTVRYTPKAVSAPSGVTLSGIASGGNHSCAQGSDSKAYCWGSNSSGQLGDGTITVRYTPTAVSAPTGVTLSGIALGINHTCAQGSDGKAYCWGNNGSGQLGDGTFTNRSIPTAVSAPTGVTLSGIMASAAHSCAQGSDGNAYCWGANGSGQLGDGTNTTRSLPTAVGAPAGVTLSGIKLGNAHTCAQGSDGKAYCWGANGSGQLGDGTIAVRYTPTAVSAPTGVTLSGLSLGAGYSCAQGSDSKAYCWGANGSGQLGDGTITNRNTPTAVSAPSGVTLSGLSLGGQHSCALGSDGPAYCWGAGGSGRLGDGTPTTRSRPVKVASSR